LFAVEAVMNQRFNNFMSFSIEQNHGQQGLLSMVFIIYSEETI